MNLNRRVETFGSGDQAWLGSRHGVGNARTVTIAATSITAEKFDGFLQAGLPLKAGTAGLYEPLTDPASDTLAGFLLTDQPNTGEDVVAAMLDHGRVLVDRLPDQAPALAAGVNGLFNLVKGDE